MSVDAWLAEVCRRAKALSAAETAFLKGTAALKAANAAPAAATTGATAHPARGSTLTIVDLAGAGYDGLDRARPAVGLLLQQLQLEERARTWPRL